MPGSLILPGEDVADVARAIKEGDATTGWRGDPGMALHRGERGTPREGTVAVYGFDARGERYLAATQDITLPGWRFELLKRLREGDWQRNDQFDRVDAANQKLRDEAAAEAREAKEELAEKLAWAIRRDIGHLNGGLTKDIH